MKVLLVPALLTVFGCSVLLGGMAAFWGFVAGYLVGLPKWAEIINGEEEEYIRRLEK